MNELTFKLSNIISQVKELQLNLYDDENYKWVAKYIAVFGGCAALMLLRILFLKIRGRLLKQPPQLYGLPIVGSFLTAQMWGRNFGLKIMPRYGDIVSYNYGPFPCYGINDLQLLNAIFSKATSRLPSETKLWEPYGVETPIVSINNDKDWLFRRKALMSSITKLLNKKELEQRIAVILQKITYAELNSLLTSADNSESNANSRANSTIWYPRKCLRNAVFNVIYFATFGKYMMIDNPRYIEYEKSIACLINSAIGAWLTQSFPKIISILTGVAKQEEKYKKALEKVYSLTEQDYKDLIANTTNNNNNNNGDGDDDDPTTIAGYLSQAYKGLSRSNINKKSDNDNTMDKETYGRLISDLMVLLTAGMDTTSHTTEVGILLLAKYPNIQEILFRELCNIFDPFTNSNPDNIDVKFDKMYKCVQFRAFINETLRIACAAPYGLSRCLSKDLRCVKYKYKSKSKSNEKNSNDHHDDNIQIACEFVDGKFDFDSILLNKENVIVYDYILQNGYSLDPNINYMLLGNRNVWNLDNDPMTLNLNYWLLKKNSNSGDDHELMFKNNINSIPFSVGKNRDCLGQSLARKELQAFLANLILKYKIEAKNGNSSSIKIKYNEVGVTHVVHPQIPVRISKR